MTENRFHIIDVFAEQRYTGNQLAVVEEAGSLSTDQMQLIAREFGYSETTFIESSDKTDGGYDVRIFTPKEEIPFAGHPTLGTTAVIREHIALNTPEEITLNLAVGPISVTTTTAGEAEILWMKQNPPEFQDEFDPDTVAEVLGIEHEVVDEDFPVQSVSTGLPTVIFPLETRDVLEQISVDRAAYDKFVAGQEAKIILAFCPEPRDRANDFAVRVFAPYYGVPEDPATGSSNGCFAGYLTEHEYVDDTPIDVRVEQGYEIKRPSLLHLRADRSADDMIVRVGGRAISVAVGRLLEE